MTPKELEDRNRRLVAVNKLIIVIASCGRRFFRHKERVSFIEMDHRYRLWYIDCWHGKRVYLHVRYQPRRKFSGGGTLWGLVQNFKRYIQTGTQLVYSLGPWPDWICGNGDLWGYGEDMETVRERAAELGVLWTPPEPKVFVESTPTSGPNPFKELMDKAETP
jgi:hypothetical protein